VAKGSRMMTLPMSHMTPWRHSRDVTTSKCFFFDNSCRNETIF